MTVSQKTPEKRYSLFVLAVLLYLFALAIFIMAPHDFVLRSLSILALLGGVQLVRLSNVHKQPGFIRFRGSFAIAAKRPEPIAWILAAVSILVLGISYLYLADDIRHGGQEGWPAYFFAGALLGCVLSVGYLVARLRQ